MATPSSSEPAREDVNLTRVIFTSAAAALGGFLFGFDSGVINGTVDALQQAFDSDAVGTGFNVASMLLGCAVGAFFAGNLADRFGRRPVMMVAAVVFIISAWGSGIAGGSGTFVFFRVLGGLAVGAVSILVPAYVSEIAPAAYRGRMASLQQLAIVVGLFAAFLSNYLIAGAAGGASGELWWDFQAWQWMFWVEILPASIFLACLLIVPESPRYLVASGREDVARRVLSRFGRPDLADQKVEDIRSTVMREKKPSLSDVLVSGTSKLHPIVWVGLGLAALQQFTGINVVFYYGSVLWQAAGFTEANALLTNVITGSVNIIFTLVAIALVDRIGRRPLLMIGAVGQAAMLAVMAIIFGTAATAEAGGIELSGTNGILALLAANGYVACFAFSWGPIMWVMLGEMFPNRFRGAALALCGISQWGSNFLITMSFPILLTSIGLGLSYGIYAAFGIVAFVFVKKYVEETRGRSLEDMSREHDELAAARP
ncbi:MAG: sugar porter family MFS transporter [Bacteroidota bacterium]